MKNIIALLALVSASAMALPTYQSQDELLGTLKEILDAQQGVARAEAAADLGDTQEEGVSEGGIASTPPKRDNSSKSIPCGAVTRISIKNRGWTKSS
jgi:hypothetical protein